MDSHTLACSATWAEHIYNRLSNSATYGAQSHWVITHRWWGSLLEQDSQRVNTRTTIHVGRSLCEIRIVWMVTCCYRAAIPANEALCMHEPRSFSYAPTPWDVFELCPYLLYTSSGERAHTRMLTRAAQHPLLVGIIGIVWHDFRQPLRFRIRANSAE